MYFDLPHITTANTDVKDMCSRSPAKMWIWPVKSSSQGRIHWKGLEPGSPQGEGRPSARQSLAPGTKSTPGDYPPFSAVSSTSPSNEIYFVASSMSLLCSRQILRRYLIKPVRQSLIMADKMSSYSPSDAKVLKVEPMVSLPHCLEHPPPKPYLDTEQANKLTAPRRSQMDPPEQNHLPRPLLQNPSLGIRRTPGTLSPDAKNPSLSQVVSC